MESRGAIATGRLTITDHLTTLDDVSRMENHHNTLLGCLTALLVLGAVLFVPGRSAKAIEPTRTTVYLPQMNCETADSFTVSVRAVLHRETTGTPPANEKSIKDLVAPVVNKVAAAEVRKIPLSEIYDPALHERTIREIMRKLDAHPQAPAIAAQGFDILITPSKEAGVELERLVKAAREKLEEALREQPLTAEQRAETRGTLGEVRRTFESAIGTRLVLQDDLPHGATLEINLKGEIPATLANESGHRYRKGESVEISESDGFGRLIIKK